MAIAYEWLVETVQPVEMGKEHEDDEIQESFYFENPKKALDHCRAYPACEGEFYRIAVVRNQAGFCGDILERQWAYVSNRELPVKFCHGDSQPGNPVTIKSHREFLCSVVQFKKINGRHIFDAVATYTPGLISEESAQ